MLMAKAQLTPTQSGVNDLIPYLFDPSGIKIQLSSEPRPQRYTNNR